MIGYRLCKKAYVADLSGSGAMKMSSNGWNSQGTPMLYTAESAALCAVELYSYVPPSSPPLDYWLQMIVIPDVDIAEVDPGFYQTDWIDQKNESQAIGDEFIRSNKYLILKVASAWIYPCFNYLINPMHTEFKNVRLMDAIPFPFDGKLYEWPSH